MPPFNLPEQLHGAGRAAKLFQRLTIDFQRQLAALAGFLEERGYRYALVGALGLAAYGLPRATQDLDLAVERRAQDDLISHLESTGYQTLHRSEGYSNHVHPDASRGRIDLVYVDPRTADLLFGSARSFPAEPGRSVPVASPEHLAAMKVVAMKNDPSRTLQDLADIRFLLTLPGVDREQIRGYFARHGLEARFDELERTL
jgi:hypothetical protein